MTNTNSLQIFTSNQMAIYVYQCIDAISIIIISKKQQPIDLAFSRKLGLDCSKLKFLGVKSTGHFRSGFESIAGSIYNVDASGVFSQDFKTLPYTRLEKDMYPIYYHWLWIKR